MRGVCKVTCFMAAVLLSALPATAQTPDGKAQEKDVEAIKALGTLYEKAINEGKLELLEPHLDKEFTGVMITNEEISDFNGLKAYWKKLWEMIGEGGQYKTTLKPEHRWICGDIAISRGTTEDYVLAASGNEYRFSSSFTAVLIKREGQWRIMRIQGSVDPLGNPFVKVIVGEAAQKAGIVAGVVALIVGIIAGFLLGRRKAAQSPSTPSPAK